MLQPFPGGLWQNDTPTLRIPYYRLLEWPVNGFTSGRAEQHLAGQIFSGLTRFTRSGPNPEGDMAHDWQVSQNGYKWQFFIRSTLRWHNGEHVETRQLQERLLMLLRQLPLRKILGSVQHIEVTHTRCLIFWLHHPDYWLPWRLASYCCRLPHPQDDRQGCGPFRLTTFAPDLVRLESHNGYHLQHPLLGAIEY